MKITQKLTILCAVLAIALAAATSVRAEEGSPTPSPIKDRAAAIKENIDKRVEQNKDARNNLLQKVDNKGPRVALTSTSTATSTKLFKREAKMEMKKKMELRKFEERKAALVRELTKAIEKMKEIVTRIEERIAKAESSGRNMTEPKTLLVTAKQKLVKAEADVLAFKNLTSTSTPTTTASSTTATSTATTTGDVDLSKPRQLGDFAIKSVKEAKDALQKVVVSIAHNMGLGDGKNGKATTTPTTGTTTPPVTGTTTPPTATSTATTTSN
jgi:hypothetical protein